MNIRKKYVFLIGSSFLFAFTGLKFIFFLAPRISLIFFIYFFRKENKWYEYIFILILLFFPKFFIVHNGWDMSIWLEIAATLFTMIPLSISLIIDKLLYKKINIYISTLIFPATYIITDLVIGLSSFGTFSSIAITQFEFKPILQLASIAGLGGISFIVTWFSSSIASIWDNNLNNNQDKKFIWVFGSIVIGCLIGGGLYYTTSNPLSKTVKIAGITVEHNTDYSAIIDINTPKTEITKQSQEIQKINKKLFTQSQKAADLGAKIIFWSEIDGIIYPEIEEKFIKEVKEFAQKNNVYFAPAILSFKYNSGYAENKIIMVTPKGEIEYEYEKTISWYPTNSDGIIDTIQTPYGKISTVICFDSDFPKFIRSVAKENIDILLIPKFDTPKISPGHTYSSSIRGVELGFSVVNQVNVGTSIATDYRGNILSYQDFATTEDKIMIADIPTKGRKTIYAVFGDWLIYISTMFLTGLIIVVLKKKIF